MPTFQYLPMAEILALKSENKLLYINNIIIDIENYHSLELALYTRFKKSIIMLLGTQ